MIEDLSFQFLIQGDDAHFGIGFVLLVVGAIIAAIVTRSKVEISRGPYFVYWTLIFFALQAVQIIWFQVVAAIAGGYLWMLMLISLVSCIATGYFHCRIAMARSRDAHGHGRMAFLAFIPFANFWLLLTPSKKAISANRAPTIPLLSGGLGVLTGFVLLAAGIGVGVYISIGFGVYIDVQSRMMDTQTQNEPVSEHAWVDSMIRSNGLEDTLRLMAAETQTPITVDEVTTLARIEADWTQLRRTYIVDLEGMVMTEEFRSRILNGICAYLAFEPILRANGSIREVYVERDGHEVGAVMVTREECGF